MLRRAAARSPRYATASASLLVTFRRDGTPVPTPVWAAEADGLLYVRTERTAGKVKRLRNDPRLLVAPCTVRGRPLGAPVQATARMLAPEDEPLAERVLAARYGSGGRSSSGPWTFCAWTWATWRSRPGTGEAAVLRQLPPRPACRLPGGGDSVPRTRRGQSACSARTPTRTRAGFRGRARAR